MLIIMLAFSQLQIAPNSFLAGACLKPRQGAYSAPQIPIADLRGPNFYGKSEPRGGGRERMQLIVIFLVVFMF